MNYMPWILLFISSVAGEWLFSLAGRETANRFCRALCNFAASALTVLMILIVAGFLLAVVFMR